MNLQIRENIALGSKKPVSTEQVEAAAEKANAARFIADFVSKYETDCGAMGSQLSGGQKQRIAIARALVRNFLATKTAKQSLHSWTWLGL